MFLRGLIKKVIFNEEIAIGAGRRSAPARRRLALFLPLWPEGPSHPALLQVIQARLQSPKKVIYVHTNRGTMLPIA